jgi:hypothetical protein
VTATKRRPGHATFDVTSPSLNRTTQEAPHTGANATHFGVPVENTDDVMLAKQRFEAASLKPFTEENVSCCEP